MTADFLLTSLVVILLPGTGVIYTLAFGLGKGFRASVIAAGGCTLGIVPHLFAAIVGLAALLHASALAFQAVKYLGVAYLFYMAWGVLQDRGALNISQQDADINWISIVRNGFLVNILNPKLSLFFLAFLPQFIPDTSNEATGQMLIHGLVFMLMTFIVFVGYGGCASLARDYVISRPTVMQWFRRGFAAAFGALGLKLALAQN